MVIAVVALILGVFLGGFILIPRRLKSVQVEKVDSSTSAKSGKKVYDVTSYVEVHPGGDAITTHAGGDATQGFYGPQHASLVFDMVDEFYIGDLEQ